MSLLTPRPDGLQANLSIYYELKFDHGTDSFLNIPNQSVLRSGSLSRFLARFKVERAEKQVIYEYLIDGRELLSKSRSIREKCLSVGELDAFRAAVEELLDMSSADPSPKSAMVIQDFRLPAPSVDPELYRLVKAPGDSPRLVVLWGCEKVQGSSLRPLDAIDQLRAHVKPKWRIWSERAGLLLLLLLLLMPGYWLLGQFGVDQPPAPDPTSSAKTSDPSSPSFPRDGLPGPSVITQPAPVPEHEVSLGPEGNRPSTPTQMEPQRKDSPESVPVGSTPTPSTINSPSGSSRSKPSPLSPLGGTSETSKVSPTSPGSPSVPPSIPSQPSPDMPKPTPQLEIVEKSNRPKDHRTITLQTRFRNSEEPFRIQSWKIDGVEQRSKQPQLEIELTEGPHTVEVQAQSSERLYTARVKIDVDTSTTFQLSPLPPNPDN